MAIRNGRVHKSSAIDTNARSLTTSETNVMANIETIPATVEGIVNKFVWKVLNLYQGKRQISISRWDSFTYPILRSDNVR